MVVVRDARFPVSARGGKHDGCEWVLGMQNAQAESQKVHSCGQKMHLDARLRLERGGFGKDDNVKAARK